MLAHAPICAVFFDLGGTLFHHLPPHHTETNLLALFDSADAQAVLSAYQKYRQQAEEQALSRPFFYHRELLSEAFARTWREFSASDSCDHSQAFCAAQTASVTQRLELRADTLPTLQALRDRGYRLAIVSNIDDDYIVPLLERTRLARYVDFWLSSERAQSCKPHAEIFHQALAQAEVQAHEVLFVGDSYAHDVAGAGALGMATAWLTVDQQHIDRSADANINALSELLVLLP
ncbi:MAG: HAD family hydrolase [Pseudomonadales bacterium]